MDITRITNSGGFLGIGRQQHQQKIANGSISEQGDAHSGKKLIQDARNSGKPAIVGKSGFANNEFLISADQLDLSKVAVGDHLRIGGKDITVQFIAGGTPVKNGMAITESGDGWSKQRLIDDARKSGKPSVVGVAGFANTEYLVTADHVDLSKVSVGDHLDVGGKHLDVLYVSQGTP